MVPLVPPAMNALCQAAEAGGPLDSPSTLGEVWGAAPQCLNFRDDSLN